MAKKLLTLCFLLLSFSLSAQVIKLSANAKPLNQILIEMRNNYNLRFSFDDKELSQFKITVHQQFSSPQQALDFLLRPISYTYIQNQGVFVIYPYIAPKQIVVEVQTTRKEWQLSGSIFDKQTGEGLPYSFVQINKTWIGCDEKGRFNYSSKTDSVFHLTLRHLGYYIQDTLVASGTSHKFFLISSNFLIREVVVSSLIDKSIHQFELPGSIRVNNLVARNIPGNEGGSVFSLLRLLPGVYSAGEQNRDLAIWGGYEGQSQVSLDGYTLFGLKNFNDNISVVNPYMVKDVKVFKGGFGARYEDKVGGIVDITGVDGNLNKPEFKANVSNLTLNTFGSLPVTTNSSLVMAYRQTFYNLYNQQSLTQLVTSQNTSSLEEYYITPNYKFFDGNVKYSGKTDAGDSYLVSLYGGKDQFDYSVTSHEDLDDDEANNSINTNEDQLHTQLGASAQYGKQWKNGNSTSMIFSFSSWDADNGELSKGNDNQVLTRFVKFDNMMQQYKLTLEHKFTANKLHAPSVGAGLVTTQSDFTQFTTTSLQQGQHNPTIRTTTQDQQIKIFSQDMNLYFSDRVLLLPNLTFNPGIRANLHFKNSHWDLQPRLSLDWQMNQSLRVAGSWGLFRQYNSKMYYSEEFETRPPNHKEQLPEYLPADEFQQIWVVANGKQTPYTSSVHRVLGAYYQQGGFSASTEAYWKSGSGLSRWKRTFRGINTNPIDSIFYGTSRAYGVDFMVRQQYLRHYAWISYSYGKTLEHFSNEKEYQPAPQDQRHEVKGALLLEFSHISLSGSYVYGSGYPTYNGLSYLPNESRKPYKRMDASISYHFTPQKLKMQVGFTILNLLNEKNLIFNSLASSSTANSNMFAVYSQAIPFTPMLFLEISF
ncbi:MAG: TonB-dependent receptor plug domain-containing protein [Bacteroidales bacterium]|nr:TonB-dependent receptor plug domain-containing protein [Bacteroidales bacterium]